MVVIMQLKHFPLSLWLRGLAGAFDNGLKKAGDVVVVVDAAKLLSASLMVFSFEKNHMFDFSATLDNTSFTA